MCRTNSWSHIARLVIGVVVFVANSMAFNVCAQPTVNMGKNHPKLRGPANAPTTTALTWAGERTQAILDQIQAQMPNALNCNTLEYAEVFPISGAQPMREMWVAHGCNRAADFLISIDSSSARTSDFVIEFRGERLLLRYQADFIVRSEFTLSSDGQRFEPGSIEVDTTPSLRISTSCKHFEGPGLWPVTALGDVSVTALLELPDAKAQIGGVISAFMKTRLKVARSERGQVYRHPRHAKQWIIQWNFPNMTCNDVSETATLELPSLLIDGVTVFPSPLKLHYSEQVIREWRTISRFNLM